MALLKNLFIYLILFFLLAFPVSALSDVALLKQTWTNSTLGANVASNAVDGSTVTAWIPADSHNGYWGVDLNHSYLIDSIAFHPLGAFVTNIYVNASTDNATWTILYHNASFALDSPQNFSVGATYRYINITVSDGTGGYLYEVYVYSSTPSLISPVNGSSQTMTFPPLTTSVNFTWTTDTSGLSSNILIAKDVNFNLIETDTTTTNNYSVQSLEAGTHYWKVRYYNSTSGSYSNYSEYNYFTITSTSSATGAGIEGVVYEFIGTTKTPLSGATVYIYNNTYTASTQTGSNGYYLFSNLANNTTYSVYASKQGYDTTAILPATTGNGTTTANDILMKIFISPYIPNFVFEKFSVRSLFDRPYPGISVSIFKNNDVIASFTGTTDSMGQVTFQLIKDQYYRIELTGGGLSSTLTKYFYAKEENYLITIASGFPTTGDRNTDINATLLVSTFNATYYNLSLFYNDTRSSTSVVNFYTINTSTNATCTQTSTSNTITLNCTVLGAGVYRYGFNATSSIYGTFQDDKVINFGSGTYASSPQVIGNHISSDILNWVCILLLVFFAGLFSIKTIKFGAVLVPSMALVMWWFKALQIDITIISIALVLGILIYTRSSETKVVYS